MHRAELRVALERLAVEAADSRANLATILAEIKRLRATLDRSTDAWHTTEHAPVDLPAWNPVADSNKG